MSDIKLKAASGGGSISIKGPSSLDTDRDLVDTSGNINLLDSQKLKVGDSADLQIYHESGNSWVQNTTGNLIVKDTTDAIYLQAPATYIQDETTNEHIAVFNSDGTVELYHDGTKQCETSANGLAFPSGKGIDFSATGAGAVGTVSSEVLTDYEHGTWSPVCQYESGGGNVSNTGLGYYTKIGNRVFWYLYVDDLDYSSAGSGWPAVTLPYTVADTSHNYSAVTFGYWNCFGSNPMGYVQKGTRQFVIGAVASGNDSTSGNTWTGTNRLFMASGQYVAA